MSAAALVLYVIFLVLVFGVRTVVHMRNTGSSGFSGLSGRVGSLEWTGGVMFIVAIVAGLVSPLLAVTGTVIPSSELEAVQPIGLGVAVVGLVLTLLAQAAMGTSWRIGVDDQERTDLVTDGAFRVVRNPVFSAMIVFAIGLVLAVPTWPSLVAFGSLMIALELQTRFVEEPYLLRIHNPEYARYASRVGRFFPGLGLIRRQ